MKAPKEPATTGRYRPTSYSRRAASLRQAHGAECLKPAPRLLRRRRIIPTELAGPPAPPARRAQSPSAHRYRAESRHRRRSRTGHPQPRPRAAALRRWPAPCRAGAHRNSSQNPVIKLQPFPASSVLPQSDLILGSALKVITNILRKPAARSPGVISDVNERFRVHRLGAPHRSLITDHIKSVPDRRRTKLDGGARAVPSASRARSPGHALPLGSNRPS